VSKNPKSGQKSHFPGVFSPKKQKKRRVPDVADGLDSPFPGALGALLDIAD
jgi:hypothetical protein